ncbi:MAG: hypothetical protein NTV07_05660, partial [Candidatus Omnitrophica bacterium]|nr:hypothetical protein [Candidatus Omnitrophota bacterium]
MDKPRTETLLLLLILFTASCLYLSSLNNPFIWDDNHLIISENNIRTFACIPEIFTTHLCHNIGASNFYRPIQSLSFMIDYAAWKLNPFGYHLTNLLLHLINIILTYLLVKKVLKNS